MAFNKRTWKGRQGTGLNKFSINGATPVPVINQPDSVTEQGDALSAGNLNDLEDRIYDAFDDIADGTQIVGKATADASGNVITTTYETKADASDLKSAIQATNARVENLEQEHGGYSTVQYRGTNAVPTGKAKYALVESIVGKSMAWNQLLENGDFSVNSGWNARLGSVSIDTTNHIATVTATLDSSNIGLTESAYDRHPITGHLYLIAFDFKASFTCTLGCSFSGGAGTQNVSYTSANSWQRLSCIYTGQNDSAGQLYLLVTNSITTGTSLQYKKVIIRDLSVIFPEGVPSTVAECVAKCPDILKYDAYGYSIVDTVVEGVKSTSINICPDDFEVGSINTNTGEDTPSTTVIRTKGMVAVEPNTTYYLHVSSIAGSSLFINACFFDISGNWLTKNYTGGYINNTFVAPANAYFMRFSMPSDYGTSYKNDIQICLNSESEKAIYHPHILDTLSLPSSVTLRSAGTVADTDELNVEVLVDGVKVNRRRQTTRCSAVYNLAELTWGYNSTYGFFYSSDLKNILKIPTSGTEVPAFSCSNYVVKARSYFQSANPEISVDIDGVNEGQILVGGTNSPTGYLVVALATESVTLLDPIENNTIQTEGGGTINTIQTQTPVIDNSMDVGYLAL